MDTIKEWALSVCTASVCGGIVYLLSPSGSMEKVLKVAVSIFFLTCLLSPLITNWQDIDLKNDYTDLLENNGSVSEYQNIYQHQVLEQCREEIKQLAEQALEENLFTAQKIEVIINIDEDNSIIIKQIEFYMDESYEEQKSEIETIIEDELGVFPIVIFVEVNTYG